MQKRLPGPSAGSLNATGEEACAHKPRITDPPAAVARGGVAAEASEARPGRARCRGPRPGRSMARSAACWRWRSTSDTRPVLPARAHGGVRAGATSAAVVQAVSRPFPNPTAPRSGRPVEALDGALDVGARVQRAHGAEDARRVGRRRRRRHQGQGSPPQLRCRHVPFDGVRAAASAARGSGSAVYLWSPSLRKLGDASTNAGNDADLTWDATNATAEPLLAVRAVAPAAATQTTATKNVAAGVRHARVRAATEQQIGKQTSSGRDVAGFRLFSFGLRRRARRRVREERRRRVAGLIGFRRGGGGKRRGLRADRGTVGGRRRDVCVGVATAARRRPASPCSEKPPVEGARRRFCCCGGMGL